MSTVWAGVGEKRRRGLRILPKNQGYFVHVTSRTAQQAFLFGDAEKRMFIKKLRQWADFSALGIITHCVMDNHFHVMLWVPSQVSLKHVEILERLNGVWTKEKVAAWESFYQKQGVVSRKKMDAAVLARMGNLPEFMRVLKLSYTRWYNQNRGTSGALWDSRYRSVVVEDSPLALMSVAAYIDLNPLRAGMVDDPLKYVWSGYGAAISGDIQAQKGLDTLVKLARGHQPFDALAVRKNQLKDTQGDWREIVPRMAQEHSQRAAPKNWKEVQSAYRIWLVNKGKSQTDSAGVKNKFRKRKGIDPIQVIAEYEAHGHVPLHQCLQTRIRAFTRGVAIGHSAYLEDLMAQYRSCFGPNRKKAACKVRTMTNVFSAMREV
ncbi:hypothetical protein P0Y35_12005 [Kiritimatiellaeota bacterium B1221]|nr:hypothetical protein [Kiritimatiellaeota bacterium B1221]